MYVDRISESFAVVITLLQHSQYLSKDCDQQTHSGFVQDEFSTGAPYTEQYVQYVHIHTEAGDCRHGISMFHVTRLVAKTCHHATS